MKKDKRIIQAEEILNVLEENSNIKYLSNLIGGFITILIGTAILDKMVK